VTNIASVLKAEISRVARKEMRGKTVALKKAVAAYRRDIAALKRRTQALERLVRRGSRFATPASRPFVVEHTDAAGRRFSAKGLRSQRKRPGVSAAEFGLLLGATAQSVCNWEQGHACPSSKRMPTVVALRTLRRKMRQHWVASRV